MYWCLNHGCVCIYDIFQQKYDTEIDNIMKISYHGLDSRFGMICDITIIDMNRYLLILSIFNNRKYYYFNLLKKVKINLYYSLSTS